MTYDDSLSFRSARDLIRLIASKQLSARELLSSTLARIDAVNARVNAIVTLVPDQAEIWAAESDERQARGEPLGILHGLPIAHKDLVQTAGIRTTLGSKLFENHVPVEDDLIVKRLRSAGAISVGKTNVPEFGAGSQTFNEVFGETLNPWDLTKTCGGSSGGAAAALSTGQVSIADGSDMGGSLRNPANFCHVVGFRPSPGRIPTVPTVTGGSNLSVLGPMARNVEDVALLLGALAGPDPACPISIDTPGEYFLADLDCDFDGARVAYSPNLGGLPVDPRISQALEEKLFILDEIGCSVEEADPGWEGADEAFKILRAWEFAARFDGVPQEVLERVKETVRWNIEAGRILGGRIS